MFESVKTSILFEYIQNEDPMRNDALMAADAAWEHLH
jgi:hypothetical protein